MLLLLKSKQPRILKCVASLCLSNGRDNLGTGSLGLRGYEATI